MAGHVVIQMGSDPCIWGMDKTEHKALADALRWLSVHPGNSIQDMDDLNVALRTGKLVVAPCSRRLLREVEDYGGEIAFHQIPGCGVFAYNEARPMTGTH